MKNNYKIAVIAFLLCWSIGISAQKMTVGYLYPAGGDRGTVVEIVVGGQNVDKATAAIVSGDGVKAEVIAMDQSTGATKKKKKRLDDQSSPQLADMVRLRITIDKKATPGLRDLRLQSTAGISNKLFFEVSEYPNLLEERGSTYKKPNEVKALPVTLCGQILPGERDFYRFKAEKGQQFVAAVNARTLVPYIADAVPGWFQSVVRVKNSKGKEVAYCDDYRYRIDPVILFTVPETDDYILEIHDAIFRGREDFSYRVTLGEIPFLQSIYPAAGKVGKKNVVELNGVNLSSNQIKFKPKQNSDNWVTAKGKDGRMSNPIAFYATNSDPLPLPKRGVTLSADQACFDTLTAASRSNRYTYEATQGEKATFEVMARRIGSLIDGRLRLLDASGKLLAESDDVEDNQEGLMTFHADPQLTYTFTQAGRYFLEVEDVLDRRGRDFFYVLQKKEAIQPFDLTVSPAILSFTKGSTALVTVTVNAKDKLKRAIELTLEGLPKGTYLSETRIPAGAKRREITVTLPSDCKEGNYALTLMGRLQSGKDNTEVPPQRAVAADDMMQAFYYHHNIPAAGFEAVVASEAPYIIAFPEALFTDDKYQMEASTEDSVLIIPVKVRRNGSMTEPIELNIYPKNKNIVVSNNILLPNETEKNIIVSFEKKELNGMKRRRSNLLIVGTVAGEIQKKGKRTFENSKYREISPFIEVIWR